MEAAAAINLLYLTPVAAAAIKSLSCCSYKKFLFLAHEAAAAKQIFIPSAGSRCIYTIFYS